MKRGVRKKFSVFFISIFILGVLIFSFFYFYSRKVQSAWWDDLWIYRKAIPVTNNTSAEINRYITISGIESSSNFQADCGDMRWVDNTSKVLPYYIVSGCGTSNLTVHVFFTTFPSGAQTIYYYYGNPNAPNGFSGQDFSTVASNYSVGSIPTTPETTTAPVAYWKLDEGQGTTVTDGGVNKLSGTLSGTTNPTWQKEEVCLSGKCLFYDGSTSYVAVTDPGTGSNLDFGEGDTITLEAWINPNSLPSTGTNAVILTKGATSTQNSRNYQLGFNEAGAIYFFKSGTTCSGGWDAVTTATTPITLDTWQLVALSYTFGTSSSVKIYHNGQLQTLESWVGDAIDETCIQNDPLWIGSDYNNTNSFNGKTDDVKIYRYARSIDQIKADYNGGLTRQSTAKGMSAVLGAVNPDIIGPVSNGLVGYWKMDEASWATNCTTASILDASGNGYDGIPCPNASAVTLTSGKFGGGGNFDGNNDYVDLTNSVLNDAETYTFSAWINPTDLNQLNVLLGISTGNGFYIAVEQTTGALELYEEGGVYLNSISSAITAGTWQHVVVTHPTDTTYRFYVNGVDVTSTTNGVSQPWVTNLHLGQFYGDYFKGKMDEVRIYNRALNQNEITQLYNWAPGPVGYWKMDDGVGNPTDSSGNGNNGTATAGKGGYKTGKYGKAYNFDGISTSINAGSASVLDNMSTFTVSAWVYPRSAGGLNEGAIVSKESGGDSGGWIFRADSSILNRWGLNINRGTQDMIATSAINSRTNNTWQYVTVVYDGSLISSNVKFYINGILSSHSSDQNGSGIRDDDANQNFLIGNAPGGQNMDGILDDVTIYNYVRTQKQIVEDMNAGHPAPGSPVGSALGHWKLDEGYGVTLNNSGNSGSLLNGSFTADSTAPWWSGNGKQGKALVFDGTNDYATVPYNAALKMSGEQTISFWWKPSVNWNATATSGQNGGLLSLSGNSADSGNDWAVFLFNGYACNDDDGRLRFGTYGDNIQTATNSWSAGEWYHIAVSYTDANNATIYVNGRVDNYNSDYVAGAIDGSNNYDLQIGRAYYDCSGVLTAYAPATIDNIKIFSSALTADQIKMEYNSGQSMVLGAVSNTSQLSGGSVASNSASAQYCVPGDTTTCNPPIAQWNFEEKIGSTINDITGGGDGGTLVNTLKRIQGKFGTGISLNGINQRITLSSTSVPVETSAFTIEGWIKPTTLIAGQDYTIFCSDNSGTGGFCFYYSPGSSTLRFCNDGSCNPEAYSVANPLTPNQWQHVGLTYNGANVAYIYVNGVNRTSSSSVGETAQTTTRYIGYANAYTNGSAFAGGIDDFTVFNYVRTPAQIAWDYNRGKPYVWTKMDECQGSTLGDSTGNGYVGNITIGALGSYTSIGTCTNVVSTASWYAGRSGKYNSSIALNGTDMGNMDDYVSYSPDPSVDGWTQVTVSAWINPTYLNNSADMAIVSKSVSTDQGYGNTSFRLGILSYPAFVPYFHVASETTGSTDAYSDVILSTGTWYHVVGTWDGSNVRTYVNGALRGTAALSGGVLNDTKTLYLGRESNNANHYFGYIDDVKIFNYALNSTQVKHEFNQGSAVRFGPITGSP